MTRNRYLYLLLRLKNPSTTKNMDIYWLRDEFFKSAIFNEKRSQLKFADYASINFDSDTERSPAYKSMISVVFPWEGYNEAVKRKTLVQEFEKYQEEKKQNG